MSARAFGLSNRINRISRIKHTRKQHERVSIFNTPGPLDEWSAATSIAEHLTLSPSRFQVGCSRGAILTDPPKLRITLRCLLEVLRNETTARRGGPGSFDGVEEGCSGLKSAAEASHGSRGASRCVSITRLGKDGPRRVARLLRCVYSMNNESLNSDLSSLLKEGDCDELIHR